MGFGVFWGFWKPNGWVFGGVLYSQVFLCCDNGLI